MFSFSLSLTSALDEGEWPTPCPGRFTPGKDSVPIVQEAGWSPGTDWAVAENISPTGVRSRTVQPVASRYTDWATPAHTLPCTAVLCLCYTGWSKSLCAPDGCIVITRCTDTFWSPCIKSILQNATWEKVSYHMWDSIQCQMNPVLASRNW